MIIERINIISGEGRMFVEGGMRLGKGEGVGRGAKLKREHLAISSGVIGVGWR